MRFSTKSAVLHERGAPRPYAQSMPLKIETLEMDEPGPGEVLVQLKAASLCHSDLSVIDGSRPRPVPMVLGHEACGRVVETGEGVNELKRDDPVLFSFVPMCGHCEPCLKDRPVLCEEGAHANGQGLLLSGKSRFLLPSGQKVHHHLGVSGFSQYTVASEKSLIKLEEGFPLDRACLFGCAVMTGVGAVFNAAKVRVGDGVVIFGMGGVGLSAVLGAAAAGAYPIVAVDTLSEKLDIAKRAGATHGLLSHPEVVEEIKEVTRGGGEFVIEAVGNEKILESAYWATRRGGTTLSIGLPHPDRLFQLPAVSLVAEERKLMGCYMGSSVPRRDLPLYMSLYQSGKLNVDLLYSETIPLEDINEAFDRLADSKVVRQVVALN